MLRNNLGTREKFPDIFAKNINSEINNRRYRMLFLNVSFMLGKKKNNIEIINGILENLTVLKIISQFYFSNFNLNILTYIYTYTQRMRPYLF